MNNLLRYFSVEELAQLCKCDCMPSKCLTVALKIFDGVLDESGEPYLGHLLRVADKQKNITGISAALLHDLFENVKDIYAIDLLEVGVSIEVVRTVELLTRKKTDTYSDYIQRIKNSGNEVAIGIKQADMEDNSCPQRLEVYSEEVRTEKQKKYNNGLRMLRGSD